MNKKRIIIGCVIGIVAFSIFAFIFYRQEATTSELDTQSSIREGMVHISNLKGHKDILSNTDVDNIQTTLYSMTLSNDTESDLYYHGTIRSGSYTHTSSEPESISFIADIPFIKKSWRVTYALSSHEADNEDVDIAITCLEEKDLLYGAFECEDFYGH